MAETLSKIIAAIDDHNSVRIESEIVGVYKTVGYGSIFDSGFSGDVVVPQSMAVDIGLKSGGVAEIELADGSRMIVKLYLCKVKIGGIIQEAATIIMGEEVLIGMGLMKPFDVCLRAGTSEAVIEPQPGYADFVGVLKRLTEGS
jgi:predicted aspartyl protease